MSTKSITQISDQWSFVATASGSDFNSYANGKLYFTLVPDASGNVVDASSDWIGISGSKIVTSIHGVVSAIAEG